MFSKLSTLKKQKASLKIKLLELRLIEQQLNFAPHLNVPVRVYRDGSRWVCSFDSDPEPNKCVIAYGESPAQACRNFDSLWNGAEGFLIDEEEIEEEF